MKDLITISPEGRTTSKDLYEFLQLDSGNYTRWCKVNIIENQFAEEGIDWGLLLLREEKLNYRPSQNYWLTITFAKKLCMVSPTDRGEQARNYFIEVERQFIERPSHLKALEDLIYTPEFGIRLLTEIQSERNKVKELTAAREADKPKVLFADSVAASDSSILIGELAKILKQNGHEMGQNRLFGWLRQNGYLINRRGTDYNMPTQKSMELGLFTIKETVVNHSDGHVSISKTPKVTGKGQVYFVTKFSEQVAALTDEEAQ